MISSKALTIKNSLNVYFFSLSMLCIYFLITFFNLHYSRFFWLDESQTFDIINSNSFFEIVTQARDQNGQPALFYLLAKPLTYLSNELLFLRLLPFSFFIATIACFLFNLRTNLILSFLLILYIIISPFSQYVAFEFRPYSLSILLLSIYVSTVMKNNITLMQYYLSTFIVLLFSYTLSLNIPLSLFLFILSFLIILNKNKDKKFTLNFKDLRLIIIPSIILILYFVNLNFISKYDSLRTDFDLTAYLVYLQKAFSIVKESFISMNILVLFSLILFLISKCRKYTIYYVAIFLVIISAYSFFFPTYILYNRISWFSGRYSHLLYLIIPILIMYLHRFTKFNPKLNYAQFCIIFISLFLLINSNNKMHPIIENHNKELSSWNKIFIENKLCKPQETALILEPYYIFTVVKYHLNNLPKENILSKNTITDTHYKKIQCIIYASNNIISDEVTINNFQLVHTNTIDRDWPESLAMYKVYYHIGLLKSNPLTP